MLKLTKRIFNKREPWVTSGLLTSSRTRTKCISNKLRNPTDNNIHTFASYNNLSNKIKRAIKANYYHAIIEENKFNMKKTWTVLNEVIDRKNDKSNFPRESIIGGNSVSDKPIIAETFNEYFSQIDYETGQNVPTTEF